MTDEQLLIQKVHDYCEAIHTQDEAAFRGLWAKGMESSLISVVNEHRGLENVTNNFLVGGIHRLYSEIKLVPAEIEISLRGDNLAVVIFRYHTECIRRETGEPYGIAGLKTQLYVKEEGQWKLTHLHYSKE